MIRVSRVSTAKQLLVGNKWANGTFEKTYGCVFMSSLAINKMKVVTLSCHQHITLFVLTHLYMYKCVLVCEICVCVYARCVCLQDVCVCVSFGFPKIYSCLSA